MEVSTKELKRCDIVTAAGRIDSQTAPQLATALGAITDAGRYKIVFEMTDVDFITSAGLRVMIDTQKTCKRRNRGEVVLVGVQEQVRSAMELVGFLPLFKLYEDTTEAVGSF
jgi:anti-sigma B factor antagonist